MTFIHTNFECFENCQGKGSSVDFYVLKASDCYERLRIILYRYFKWNSKPFTIGAIDLQQTPLTSALKETIHLIVASNSRQCIPPIIRGSSLKKWKIAWLNEVERMYTYVQSRLPQKPIEKDARGASIDGGIVLTTGIQTHILASVCDRQDIGYHAITWLWIMKFASMIYCNTRASTEIRKNMRRRRF